MALFRSLLVVGALMLGCACGVSARGAPGAPASAAQAASAPFSNLPLNRQDSSSGTGSLLFQLVVAGVLIAALGAVYKLRQGRIATSGGAGSATLRTLQTLRLTQSTSLHVVQWGGEELLVACTAQNAAVLSKRAPGDAADKPQHGRPT